MTNLWQKFLGHCRAHPRATMAVLVSLVMIGGFGWLWQHAHAEAEAHKNPLALRFEQGTDEWLARPRSASEFAQALNAGQVAEVALANGRPGLVLYSLKNGEKASTSVPGCSSLGCTGTVLDKLGERSAAGGFALVGVDIDGRTRSQRALNAVEAIIPPILLMLVVGYGLIMLARVQTSAGNNATTVAVRPDIRFADAIGNDEAKSALKRVKAFLHDPAQYAKLGASAPRSRQSRRASPGPGTCRTGPWPARARPTSSRWTAPTSPPPTTAPVSPRSRRFSSWPASRRPACCSSTRWTASASARRAARAAAPNRR
jgi:cell division protease FtsH